MGHSARIASRPISRAASPEQGLLVAGNQGGDPFRWRGPRGIVDLLGALEAISHLLKLADQVGTADTLGEARTIAEEQTFEFVHHDVRQETRRIEARAQIGNDVFVQRLLNCRRLVSESKRTCPRSARPGFTAFLRQAVESTIVVAGNRDPP